MLLVFNGCSVNQPNTPADNTAGEAKELKKIVISEFRGINWMSAYVADLLGYFEEEGLDAEFIIYKDGPIAFQGMHAGDSDFCRYAGFSTIFICPLIVEGSRII